MNKYPKNKVINAVKKSLNYLNDLETNTYERLLKSISIKEIKFLWIKTIVELTIEEANKELLKDISYLELTRNFSKTRNKLDMIQWISEHCNEDFIILSNEEAFLISDYYE